MHTLPLIPSPKQVAPKKELRHFMVLLAGITLSMLSILTLEINQPKMIIHIPRERGHVAGSLVNEGDINQDLTVNIYDLGILAALYDKSIDDLKQPNQQLADLNKDGIINVFDVSILVNLYGTVYLQTPLPLVTEVAATLTPEPTQMPTPTITIKPTQPQRPQFPAQVLNLTNWKITLPTQPTATEIKQPTLATFSNSEWFAVFSGNGVRFRAPVNGGTTSGSSYPRSELREMTDNGLTNASWTSSSGTHTMIIDEAITALPKSKPHIVAGQIHDAKDDIIVIRLEDNKLFIDINGTDGPILDPNYELGRRFTVTFVVKDDATNIFYNRSTTSAYTLHKQFSGAYFKAGAYTQSNCTKEAQNDCNETTFGEVIIYGLQVTHE
ncbi:hypothetical protein HGA91_02685 [candidate division WWE3 bacterium]|nr:hypothetical protein [candidate division WWE3 bacterium]